MLQNVRLIAICIAALGIAAANVFGSVPVSANDATIQMRVVNIAWNDALHIRKQPSAESRIIGMIPPDGRGITFLGLKVDQWVFVRFDNTEGWVSSRFVVAEVAGWVSKAADAAASSPQRAPVTPYGNSEGVLATASNGDAFVYARAADSDFQTATTSALNLCHLRAATFVISKSLCKVRANFTGRCVAVALNSNVKISIHGWAIRDTGMSSHGWAVANSLEAAKSEAIARCEESCASCKIDNSYCLKDETASE